MALVKKIVNTKLQEQLQILVGALFEKIYKD